jgi:hypothetical protein
MTDTPRSPGAKTRGRPFQPGNPGRKPGSRNRVTEMAEQLMADDAAGIVRAVIAAAQGGDMTAAKLVLDRIAPVRKGRPVGIALPPVQTAADVAIAVGTVVEAVSGGSLTPEEGQMFSSILEGRRKALETEELEQRIAALEQHAR